MSRNRTYYYYKIIRKTIIAFLDIFNDIEIGRYDVDGTLLKQVEVPIKFGPKSKAYMFLKELGRNEEMLPMISVILSGIDFDVTRMTNRHENIRVSNDTGAKTTALAKNMTPYNLGFNLTIWALHMVDIDQIYEQILPYFTPHAFIRINVPELDLILECKVILNSCSPVMTDDVGEEEARVLKWDTAFTVQTYLFLPATTVGVIGQQNIRFFSTDEGWADRSTETTITSGANSPASETMYLEGIDRITDVDGTVTIMNNYEIFEN